jgi:hypothetical protein
MICVLFAKARTLDLQNSNSSHHDVRIIINFPDKFQCIVYILYSPNTSQNHTNFVVTRRYASVTTMHIKSSLSETKITLNL